jgi:hypothetical protein
MLVTTRWRFLLLAIAAVGVAGCGGEPERQTIPGKVTLKGQPLPSGVVRIHGPGDRLSSAMIQPDGTFAITDVMPGKVQISIVDDPSSSGGGMPPPAGAAPPPKSDKAAVKRVPIPAKYKDVKTSGLEYDITPEMKELVITLD